MWEERKQIFSVLVRRIRWFILLFCDHLPITCISFNCLHYDVKLTCCLSHLFYAICCGIFPNFLWLTDYEDPDVYWFVYMHRWYKYIWLHASMVHMILYRAPCLISSFCSHESARYPHHLLYIYNIIVHIIMLTCL